MCAYITPSAEKQQCATLATHRTIASVVSPALPHSPLDSSRPLFFSFRVAVGAEWGFVAIDNGVRRDTTYPESKQRANVPI